VESPPYFIKEKLWKTKNPDKASSQKPDLESASRLRVGKVLAPHNARPTAVPLIKQVKECNFFLNLHFSQKDVQNKQKFFF